ncbi:uncharacterized protein MONBRDRAFT_9363 [Monosiga brevicollis MX1]|uniref:Uncharacterized protein n=1 Tax=Monosiga brevicollis TaxID=81824 RepID=A9V2X2_MONBE|nr:uncharacterized protein MONBRDRAFT_9363 [Monosiga brevicollis MX1]EDQ87959.1 predicted protein [Monosiga brevicollis MX1]|eukprot:XP_001747035.1 hypothetical protein [Monosiga brevicollis MX1]
MPLHYAVAYDQADAINVLLQARVKVNCGDAEGRTPLHMAVHQGNVVMTKTLLAAVAVFLTLVSLNQRSPQGTECAKLLLSTPARNQINQKDMQGMTALHWAGYHKRPNHTKYLLHKGADEMARDSELKVRIPQPRPLLFFWALLGLLTLASALTCAFAVHSHSASLVNDQDSTGTTPAHLAAGNGHANVLKVLARCPGIALDACDRNGRTALHWAAAAGHQACVAALLAFGADPSIVDQNGAVARDYAMRSQAPNAQAIAHVAALQDKLDLAESQLVRCNSPPPSIHFVLKVTLACVALDQG